MLLHCTAIYVIIFVVAGVAQLVEQLIRNQQVAGSSPATSSTPVKDRLFYAQFSEVQNEPL